MNPGSSALRLIWTIPRHRQTVTRRMFIPGYLDRIDTNGNKFFARNPYYHVVDQEGNQLPYIDEQEAMIVQDKDVRALKLISGEIHAAGENPLPVSDYTMLKENEANGDYSGISV